MNIEIDQVFAELGKLHMQSVVLQEQLAKLQAELGSVENSTEGINAQRR